MAFALAAEWRLWSNLPVLPAAAGPPSSFIVHPSSFQFWGIVSGVAWALGLWTSLYEPVILLVLTLLAAALWNRTRFPPKGAAAWFGYAVRLDPVARVVDRRLARRRRAGLWARATARSSSRRGRGRSASWPAWPRGTQPCTPGRGWRWWFPRFCCSTIGGQDRAVARANLLAAARCVRADLLATALGIFSAAGVRARACRSQFGGLPTGRWRIWSSEPSWCWVSGRWRTSGSSACYPPERLRDSLAEQTRRIRFNSATWRRSSGRRRRKVLPVDDPPATTILAPWWLSPPLAYWSGQPAVAGSSHEALPGHGGRGALLPGNRRPRKPPISSCAAAVSAGS